MKMKFVTSFALIVGLLTAAGPLLAHHGSVAYDTSKSVVLKGATVTKLMWVNPHSFLMFDATDDKGVVQHWVGEAGSPNALTLLGWTQNSVVAGDKVTVYVFQSKTGKPVGRLNKIVLADGSTLRDSAKEARDSELGKGGDGKAAY